MGDLTLMSVMSNSQRRHGNPGVRKTSFIILVDFIIRHRLIQFLTLLRAQISVGEQRFSKAGFVEGEGES